LKAYINKNEVCAKWLLHQFCNFQILEENFLQCFNKEIRKLNAGLLYCAMLKAYETEHSLLKDYWVDPSNPANNKTVLGNLALVLLFNIFQVKRFVAHCSQYFQLLSRLTQLGPEMREFLLRARAIGLLLEFFYDDISPHKDLFRDMSEIRPIELERPEIGLPTQIDKKQMSQFQEMLEKKRQRELATAIPKYKYLTEAVENLIRSFQNGENKSIYQTDSIAFDGLIQAEKDLYQPDAKFIKMFFQNGNNASNHKNRALKSFCKGHIHYAWNNEKGHFQDLLNVMIMGLQESDYLNVKPYLALVQYLLKNPGGTPGENRFDHVITTFLESVQNNQQFYKFMEVMYEFIFKVTSAYPHVLLWFTQNPDKWRFLV